MFCAAFFLNFRGFSRAKQGTKAEELSTLLLLTWVGSAPRSRAAVFSGGKGARLVRSRQLHRKAITNPSSFLMGAGCRHCPPLARFDERLQYAAGFALCRSLPQPDVAISCFFGSLGRSNSLVGLTHLHWPVPPPVFASSDMAARPDPTAPTARSEKLRCMPPPRKKGFRLTSNISLVFWQKKSPRPEQANHCPHPWMRALPTRPPPSISSVSVLR